MRAWARWGLLAAVLSLLLVVAVPVGGGPGDHRPGGDGAGSAAVVVSLPVGSTQAGAGLRLEPRIAARSGGGWVLLAAMGRAADASVPAVGRSAWPAAAALLPPVVAVSTRGRSPPEPDLS